MERTVTFIIEGVVDTEITVTELSDGTLKFDIDVLGTSSIGDLRGLFFDLEDYTVDGGLTATGADVTAQNYGEGSIERVLKDVNINGDVVKTLGKFDAAVSFGTSGIGDDDIQTTSFILSHESDALTLDMLSFASIGLRYTSVGEVGGERSESTKIGGAASGVAQNDLISVSENSSASTNALANDEADPSSSVIGFELNGTSYAPGDSANVVIGGAHLATLSVASDGTVTLTADGADVDGLAQGSSVNFAFAYTSQAPGGSSATAIVSGTVTGTNDAPYLTAGSGAAQEDGPSIDVDLAALGDDVDSDDDGTTLSYAIIGAPTEGTASISGTTLSFDPGADFQDLAEGETRDVTITIEATDSHGATASNDVVITVTGTNDGPRFIASYTARLSEANSPSVLSADGSIQFADPDLPDRPEVTVEFLNAGWSRGPNTLSQAQIDALSTPLILSPDSGNTNTGEVAFTYTVAPSVLDFIAEGERVVLNYLAKVTDEAGAFDTALATVSITGTNDGPTFAAGVGMAQEDGPSIDVDLAALGDDVDSDDDGSTLSYAVVGAPAEGTASISGTTLIFDPGADFQDLAEGETRDVTVAIEATDSHGATASNDVVITVTGTNDAPTLTAGMGAAEEDGPSINVDLALLGGDVDSDDDGTTLTYAITGMPAEGTASISGTTLTFDPGPDFQDLGDGETRDVTVTIEATDSHGATASNDVVITVTGTNDAPVAVADFFEASEDGVTVLGNILDNDFDPEGDLIFRGSITSPSPPFDGSWGISTTGGGAATFIAGTQFQWLSEGETVEASVLYDAVDEHGARSDTAQIVVSVIGSNDGPTLAAGAGEAQEDGPSIDVDLAVLGDDVDSDDDGTTLTYAVIGMPSEGTATISGTTLSFDPGGAFQDLGEGETRDVTVTIEATDSHGATATNDVVITVTGKNDAPVTMLGELTTDQNSAGSLNVLSNDTDPDGAVLSVSHITGSPFSGSTSVFVTSLGGRTGRLTLSENGDLDFDPLGNFDDLAVGDSDTFAINYTATDGNGGSTKDASDGRTFTAAKEFGDGNMVFTALDPSFHAQYGAGPLEDKYDFAENVFVLV
ncbi:beta strand repeat-containing protein [Cribrihabitans pelagius]|uniref:beta strand repeat-containing protein n=1 Tax=Cribrihabitans pelagius TaxID=1765746 RepID=UPI003B58CA40